MKLETQQLEGYADERRVQGAASAEVGCRPKAGAVIVKTAAVVVLTVVGLLAVVFLAWLLDTRSGDSPGTFGVLPWLIVLGGAGLVAVAGVLVATRIVKAYAAGMAGAVQDAAQKARSTQSKLQVEIERRTCLERERDLAESRLEAARNELAEFAYIASHDLQAPLRTMESFAQLLERRYRAKLDSEAEEFINFIIEGAEQGKALVKALLVYSRVETHGKTFRPVDCNEVVADVLSELCDDIRQAEADVQVGTLPVVYGDVAQIRCLWKHLIVNALKFRREGDPCRVRMTAEPASSGELARMEALHSAGVRDAWSIQVVDNGVGIPKKDHARVFTMFEALHGEEIPGLGAGLAICRRIVERHNGCIWIESDNRPGAAIHILLPAASEAKGRKQRRHEVNNKGRGLTT